MQTGELERLIKKCLANFHSRRIKALNNLSLKQVLRRKNPYLFRANGVLNAPEIINEILRAHISSSDEGIFAEEFFEPICKAVSNLQIAAAKGTDFIVETENAYEVISFKSGPNSFNSSQVSKQNQQFEEIQRSLRATLRSLRKEFIPILGCGYGKVDAEPTKARKYYKLAGQALWERITGDPDFYMKLIILMRNDPQNHRAKFKAAWDRAINRFVKDFSQDFCDEKGNILWPKLLEFNSGKPSCKARKICC